MPPHRALLCLCLVLVGCGGMPDLASPAPPAGPAPEIAPLDGLLAQVPPPGNATATDPTDPTGLSARAAALQARATKMRGPVADPATRERLAASLR